MLGEQGLTFFVNLTLAVYKDTLPLVLVAEPHSMCFVFHDSLGIFEEPSHQPLALFTEDVDNFEEIVELCGNLVNFNISLPQKNILWVNLS